jgi:hypothetical protein
MSDRTGKVLDGQEIEPRKTGLAMYASKPTL